MLICSTDRPWGVHAPLRRDEDCPRCSWTAPGPIGGARADSLEAAAAGASAEGLNLCVRH
ncbi:MAG: hypothetical protein QOJ27_1764 [Sphingomonadales bacterium]|nr:hypothetical protein [Sphingomonadales bacterium]